MENQAQGNDNTAKNNSRDSESAQLKLAFDNPDYKCWYADTEKYEAAESTYWRRQNIIASLGLILNIFTFAAAAVAACIAYNAFVQTKRQANEAKRQATAAETQIAVAKDTEERQLRAYVLLASATIRIEKDNTVLISLVAKNYGLTPAYDFKHWSCAVIREGNPVETKIPSLPTPYAKMDLPTSVVAPGDVKHKIFHGFCEEQPPKARALTSAEIAGLKSSTWAVYAYGEATYRDAFGGKRITRYRIFSNDAIGIDEGRTVDAEEGNCADQDCTK